MDRGDWKTQFPSDSRSRVVNKIMETLIKQLPFIGPEGINELRKIAVRFEDKIFSNAINQTEYLRQISLKMLSMETKSQNAAGSSSSVFAADDNSPPVVPGFLAYLDKLPVETSKENEDLSSKAMARFNILLRSLSQPMSLKDIAKTWDACARAVICEYAQQFGGGTFSSKYGTWEKYVAAS